MPLIVKKGLPWLLWLALTAGLGVYLFQALNTETEASTVFLPGATSHGHYQIEAQCSACHDSEAEDGIFTSEGVSNKGCVECHGDDLSEFSDSHPVHKFKNPENAVFTDHIDALSCKTCHIEHAPERTGEMGVTLPDNFCAHCHEVTLENLESHKNLAFNSCATSGCHNYHDNMALAPSFLLKHYGEADHLEERVIASPTTLANWLADGNKPRAPLSVEDADAPAEHLDLAGVHETSHALVGVNCRDCHSAPKSSEWVAKPDHTSCAKCHDSQVSGFLKGKHGMRLAHESLGPMTPGMARKPMKPDVAHSSLSCNSCHEPHNYENSKTYAAQQACVKCHDDEHTRNYESSAHFGLWQQELAGDLPPGSGVSCASCHLPREDHGEGVSVNHNQSANLTPNEKMLRGVCMQCHGMQFSMDSLSDPELIERNFHGRPTTQHPGIGWTVDAAIARGDEGVIALRNYLESGDGSSPEGTAPAESVNSENTTTE